VWAHADPTGWDCSGFVTYVLHHDFGLTLPDNQHTVTGTFLTWSGATTVTKAQTAPGDLVCWLGHIGIAVDANNYVNAPGFGIATRIQPIPWGSTPPTIRRPNAYGPKALK
jgi:cell wall-associated NlpC family hydrolase